MAWLRKALALKGRFIGPGMMYWVIMGEGDDCPWWVDAELRTAHDGDIWSELE